MKQANPFNSILSFQPIYKAWEKVALESRPGVAEIYNILIDKVKAVPELHAQNISLEALDKHRDLVDQIFATIFPVTFRENSDLYAAVIPFSYTAVFASEKFAKNFLTSGDKKTIVIADGDTSERLDVEKKACAYQLILNKLYNIELAGSVKSIHPYTCPETGLDRYLEVEFDTRFVNVQPVDELPPLPSNCQEACHRISDILQSAELMEWLPLDRFVFEGIELVEINDVTHREAINNIKNTLLTLESFSDLGTFEKLQQQVQSLMGVGGIHIGILPVFYLHGESLLSSLHIRGSILLKNLDSEEEKNRVFRSLLQLFSKKKNVLVIPSINNETIQQYSFLQQVQQQGWCGIIVCPLYNNNQLSGILEVVTGKGGILDYKMLGKIEAAIPLFELALRKSSENLDARLNKIIKEQFTAVQSSVEWRFTESAMNYLLKSETDENTKLDPIVFEHVYPLYGAIDVRNSSTERNLAIQKDMLDQLAMAGDIIKKARKFTKLPLLKEVQFKIRKYTHSVSNIVLSDDELSINQFLKEEVISLFKHLHSILPELQETIDQYLSKVSTVVDMLYQQRKAFDDSITFINHAVSKFIDREQLDAQKIFPHYFERFVTDGVDYNIYIGQSITPQLEFNEFYLKNIKIWHLTTLTRAAQLTKALESQIEIPLQTTQLILAHSNPISISFRPAERKFDVDGAYNIRYEIIKKRIDKVRIRDTEERLTKPGTLAIVYTQAKEAKEYCEYIEFLQHEGLLEGELEWLDLEELQGVSGLKAIRVAISSSQSINSKELAVEVSASIRES